MPHSYCMTITKNNVVFCKRRLLNGLFQVSSSLGTRGRKNCPKKPSAAKFSQRLVKIMMGKPVSACVGPSEECQGTRAHQR